MNQNNSADKCIEVIIVFIVMLIITFIPARMLDLAEDEAIQAERQYQYVRAQRVAYRLGTCMHIDY